MSQNSTQPSLTGASIDRAAHLRDDAGALTRMQADEAARSLVFALDKPLFRVSDVGIALEWLPLDAPLVAGATETPVFLGLDQGAPRYAVNIGESEPPEGCKFIDMRSALLSGDFDATHPEMAEALTGERADLPTSSGFGGDAAAVAAIARAVTGWHLTHPHCARCGGKSAMSQGGWRRDCPACGAQHFPRTDPVVIMVVEREGRVAIARNVNFPGNLYSLIAGFVEPGESIEEAVRRETLEELGLRVGRVDYVSSQPWPFPASLMLGCIAEALDDDFTLEEAEIADARWLDRDQLAALFRGENEEMAPPRKAAIASTLLRDWLERRIGVS